MNTFVHFQYYLICFSSFTPHRAIRRLCIKYTSANTHRLNAETQSQGLSEVPISLIPTFSNLTIFQKFQFNVIFYVTPSPIRANTTLVFNQFLSHVKQVNCLISCVCALALSADCKFLMVFPIIFQIHPLFPCRPSPSSIFLFISTILASSLVCPHLFGSFQIALAFVAKGKLCTQESNNSKPLQHLFTYPATYPPRALLPCSLAIEPKVLNMTSKFLWGLAARHPCLSSLLLCYYYPLIRVFLQFLKCNTLHVAAGPLYMKVSLPAVLFSSSATVTLFSVLSLNLTSSGKPSVEPSVQVNFLCYTT